MLVYPWREQKNKSIIFVNDTVYVTESENYIVDTFYASAVDIK